MSNYLWLSNIIKKPRLYLKTLSIKKLTLIGFSSVTLPLIFALSNSAVVVNSLAKQSESAIFDATEYIKNHNILAEKITKLQRLASQQAVLGDTDLLSNYYQLSVIAQEQLTLNFLQHSDTKISETAQLFIPHFAAIERILANHNSTQIKLDALNGEFKQLTALVEQIEVRINTLIANQTHVIKATAVTVKSTLMNSLWLIPIIILIAIFFIIAITRPMKRLIAQIQNIEQGNFEKEINLKGPNEINEIIDALEIMRTRLHALELQKSSFIRHISHELKTPLAAVREGTELLHDNSVGKLNNEQQEISDIIKSSVTRLQRLIEDLLAFNIVLDSTSLQDVEKFSVDHVISNAINERKLDIKRKHIKINLDTIPMKIHGNAKHFLVILDNLLSNAIKYSPNHATIVIVTVIKDQHLVLSVIDEGAGISESSIDSVFEAFYQGAAPKDAVIKGSGLGLTIVQELVMRMNGSIEIFNNQNESGCTAQLSLPRAQLTFNDRS